MAGGRARAGSVGVSRPMELSLEKEAPSGFIKPSVSTHPLIEKLYL